jgi:hypothetical protein
MRVNWISEGKNIIKGKSRRKQKRKDNKKNDKEDEIMKRNRRVLPDALGLKRILNRNGYRDFSYFR